MEEGAGPDATVPKEPCDNKPTEDDIRDLLADSSPVPSPSPVTLLTSDEENGTAFDAVPKQAQPDQLDQSLSEKPEPDDAEDLFAGMDDSDGPASRKRAISEDRKEKKKHKKKDKKEKKHKSGDVLEIDDDKTTAPSVASTALVAVKQTAAAALEQIQKESVCTCEMCGVQSVKDEKGVTVTWAKYRTVVMLGDNREQTKMKIAVGEKCLPCVLSVLVAFPEMTWEQCVAKKSQPQWFAVFSSVRVQMKDKESIDQKAFREQEVEIVRITGSRMELISDFMSASEFEALYECKASDAVPDLLTETLDEFNQPISGIILEGSARRKFVQFTEDLLLLKDIQLKRENTVRQNQGLDALKHLLAKRAESMHQTRKFGGSLKFSDLSAKVKAWKQSSQQEDAFDKLMKATTDKADAQLKLEVMGQEDDDDDMMLAALTKSRLADDTEGPESAAAAKAKAKAAALQPGKRFQPPDANASSKKQRVPKAAKQPPAGAAHASTPSSTVVRQPKGSSSAQANTADIIQKHLEMCVIEKVFGGNTSRMDLYQCKRTLAALEKRGCHEEASKLDARLRVATSAHTLIPTEAAKLGLDQVQVHGAAVQEAAEAMNCTEKIPENIYINLINRFAREAPRPFKAAEAAEAAKDKDQKQDQDDNKWSDFFLLILPWRHCGEGHETLTLTQPAVRFLILRGKSPEELVRISDRCLAEKIVGIVKGGRDSREALVTFALKFREFFLARNPSDGHESGHKAFSSWRAQCIDLVTSILAIAGAGKPGEYDTQAVKRMTTLGEASAQSLSGLCSTALSTSSYWQDQLRSFWSYAYAEQAASVEFASLLKALSEPETCEMDSALLAVQRLPVWQDSLRPGSTAPLEAGLKACFQKWATDCVGAPVEEHSDDTGKPKFPLADLLNFGKQFLQQLPKKESDDLAPLFKKVESEAQTLARSKLSEGLDKAALALVDWKGEDEELLQTFTNTSKACSGLFFSDSVSPKDIDSAFTSLMRRPCQPGQISQALSKQLHQAMMFLANHANDQSQRTHLLLMASFDKTSRDMTSFLKLITSMGDTLQDRMKNELFHKTEGLLMSTQSKFSKFKAAVESSFENMPEEKWFISKERVAKETEVSSEVTHMCQQHAEGALDILKKRLAGIFQVLEPIAGGMEGGKAWADGIEEGKIVEHGTKNFLHTFTKKIEKPAVEAIHKLREALAEMQNVCSKYGQDLPEEHKHGAALMQKGLVMVSEALLLRALNAENAPQEIRSQMRRMADKKVGAINHAVLTAAQKVLKTAP